MHPQILYEIGKDRQRERIKGVEQYRLVMQARAGQPSLITRLLEKLGGLLIRIGGQLQKRHASQSINTLGWAEK